jgi:magnesium-transporting ATPase (P-type)
MSTPQPASMQTSTASSRANRAIGAMFYGAFGGAWLGLWSYRSTGEWQLHLLALIVIATAGILFLAYSRYRKNAPALQGQTETPEKQKADRMFHIINVGQWVLILIVGNVLSNIGLGEWVLAAAIFIVGLHFLPLASLFHNPPHYVTGVALMLVAVIYPFVAPSGAASPAGCLCAGLILWASALWAVTATPASA